MAKDTDTHDASPALPSSVPTADSFARADDNWRRLLEGKLTRGRFLTGAIALAGAAVSTFVGGTFLVSALSPLGTEEVEHDEVDLGSVDDYPVGQFVKRSVHYPSGHSGEYVAPRAAYVRRNPDDFMDPLFGKHEQFSIIWNRCAHLGCPVALEGTEFVCPCHGGVYNAEGLRLAGPPPRPLDRFSYRVDGTTLKVGAPYSIRRNGKFYERVALQQPGQASSGFESHWYPIQEPQHP